MVGLLKTGEGERIMSVHFISFAIIDIQALLQTIWMPRKDSTFHYSFLLNKKEILEKRIQSIIRKSLGKLPIKTLYDKVTWVGIKYDHVMLEIIPEEKNHIVLLKLSFKRYTWRDEHQFEISKYIVDDELPEDFDKKRYHHKFTFSDVIYQEERWDYPALILREWDEIAQELLKIEVLMNDLGLKMLEIKDYFIPDEEH